MRVWAYLPLLAALASGCGGPSGPPTYEVSGLVTWDGAPLPEGDIIFTTVDRSVVPDVGTIRVGAYRLRAQPGKKRVSIRASKLVPGSKGAMNEPIFDNYIPDRYNAETTLTADVTADGPNRFDFALTKSSPKKP
jgi:hypothetical protein